MLGSKHIENRNEFPVEELLKYEGKYVAWSLDGTRILAGDKDPLRLDASLTAAGFKPDDYVLSFVEFES